MIQPISWSDHSNTPDPQNATGSFLGERIVYFRWQRPGLTHATRGAVNAIGDNAPNGPYNHYIPYDRIFQKMTGDMAFHTRGQIIGYLDTAATALGINTDQSNIDPQLSRVAFDSWVTWVMDEICDWPRNIYRWPTSTGDAGGTAVDTPTHAPAALTTRLNNAALALNAAIGVVIT